MTTSRRRDLEAIPMHDRDEQKMPVTPSINITSAFSYITGRRRRLFTYLAVFTAMLAFSYLLDLRKDPIYDWIQKERGVRFDSKPFPITHPNSVQTDVSSNDDQFVTEPDRANTDAEMSEQELKDVVDQFIDHVDQESIVNDTKLENEDLQERNSQHETYSSTVDQTKTGLTSTTTVLSPMSNMTIEEQFLDSQRLLDRALANKTLRTYLDDQDVRTFRALALQATRGDCEKSAESGTGSVLFKTDAEASSAEIEKTDALYGAWCVFTGRYQSDAMREYISATESLRERAAIDAREYATKIEENEDRTPFHENEFSIEDVISAETLAKLRTQSELVKPHLSDGDSRLISALGLQAAFGDCITYAKIPKDEEKKSRDLLDPLLKEKVKRKDGALWGAWCVFSRTTRSNAAEMLTERVEGFWKQLDEHNQSENSDQRYEKSAVTR